MAETPDVIELGPIDPVKHVEDILDAGAPVKSLKGIPMVTAESAKLTDMMDNLENLTDFAQLEEAAEALRNEKTPKNPAIDPVKEPVKLPPPPPRQSPKAATPKAPKPANVVDYEPVSSSRRRRRTGGSSSEPVALPTSSGSNYSTTALTGEHVASIIKMTHAIGSTVLGPAFTIDDDSAKMIGDAAMPVLEDFGVQVASRAVHMLMLVSTVAMIEGPIMMGVWLEMKSRAEAQRLGVSTMEVQGNGKGYREAVANDALAQQIAMATGVMVGNAPEQS